FSPRISVPHSSYKIIFHAVSQQHAHAMLELDDILQGKLFIVVYELIRVLTPQPVARLWKIVRKVACLKNLIQIREMKRIIFVMQVAALRIFKLGKLLPRNELTPYLISARHRNSQGVAARNVGQIRNGSMPNIENITIRSGIRQVGSSPGAHAHGVFPLFEVLRLHHMQELFTHAKFSISGEFDHIYFTFTPVNNGTERCGEKFAGFQAQAFTVFELNGDRLFCDRHRTAIQQKVIDRKSTRLNSSHVSISYAV